MPTDITVARESDGFRIRKKGRRRQSTTWHYVGRRGTRWICSKTRATCFIKEVCPNETDTERHRIKVQHLTKGALYLTRERNLSKDPLDAATFYDDSAIETALIEFAVQ